MGIIGGLFSAIVAFFSDLFNGLLSFLKTLFTWLLDGLAFLFKPLLQLLDAIFYFIYKLGIMLVEVIMIVVGVVRLVVGLLIGGARTILSLAYDGRDADLGGMAPHFQFLQPFIDALHLNVIAGIATFGLWIITFYAAQRIIGDFK